MGMTAMTATQIVSATHSENLLVIEWADGKTSRLDALWLRDHCQMPASRNPDNGQRLFNVIDIPEDLTIAGVEHPDGNHLEITFLPEKHVSRFTTLWLRENCYCINEPFDDRSAKHKNLWRGDSFNEGLPGGDYIEFTNNNCKRSALQAFSDYDFILLTGVPCKSGQVLELITHFGFNRKTNYGELFEVRPEIKPNNLAYSNLGLGYHTDNPYRDPVPSIQLLHCLSNSAAGGNSILVDGFSAAGVLRQESPEHFATLVENWVNFRFSDHETDLYSRVPLIETNALGDVIRVRYNNWSISIAFWKNSFYSS